VIHDDHRRIAQGRCRRRFPDTGGDDVRQHPRGGQAGRKSEVEAVRRRLERGELGPQRRPDRTLRAEEEGDEHELALAARELGPDPGAKGPGRFAAEFGGGNAVAVAPRNGGHFRPGEAADRRRRPPQAGVGGGFERAVVDEGDGHGAGGLRKVAPAASGTAPAPCAVSNHASRRA